MTKYEMAMEITKDVKWTERNKISAAKKAAKQHSKEYIEKIYKAYLQDKEHALFYACRL